MDYEKVFENVPCALFIVDQDMRVLDFNRLAFALFRAEPDATTHASLGDALQCESALSRPGGCGTSKHCQECPLRNSVANSLRSEKIKKSIVDLTLMTGRGLIAEAFMVSSALADQFGDQRRVVLCIELLSDWDRVSKNGPENRRS
jgi:hypothetical protein